MDTAGLVSFLKLSSFKSWMRLDTEISLCVREDEPSSEGELVHVDLHPQLWDRGCCLGTACQPWVSPSFLPTPSLQQGMQSLTVCYLQDLNPEVRPCVPGSLNESLCHPVGGMTGLQEAHLVF